MTEVLKKYNLVRKNDYKIDFEKDYVYNHILNKVKLSSFDHISNVVNMLEKNEKIFVGKVNGDEFILKKNTKALEFNSNITWIEIRLKEINEKSTKVSIDLIGCTLIDVFLICLAFLVLFFGGIFGYIFFDLHLLACFLLSFLGILLCFGIYNATETNLDNSERIVNDLITNLKNTPYNTV